MSEVLTKRKMMSFEEWFKLLYHGYFEQPFQFEQLSKPRYVGDKIVPNDLNDLTFGQVVELQGIQEVNSMFIVPLRVILGMSTDEVMQSSATEVVRFAAWAAREMERINKLFASTNRKPTDKERKAGIESLRFGIFGTVDYYAQRMGIKDHEEVMSVPWMRVYKCLQIDSEKAKYELRLRKVYESENGRK